MQGVVYYELLKPNESITGDRYQLQLNRLNETLLEKRPAVVSNRRKVMLLHDDARPHVVKAVKEILMQLEWEVLSQPAYSPDLASSDYYLFRSMQHGLVDTHFRNYENVRKWIDEWIASKDQSSYCRRIHLLPQRWEKCVANEGKYFD